MKVFSHPAEIKKSLLAARSQNLSVGLVPTMGALHKGHLALVQKALDENQRVVVSIFVNPTQFNNPDDLQKYPRVLDEDLQKLSTLEADRIWVFSPQPADIYEGEVAAEEFDFDGIDEEMEGKYRPGHFQGVATIVKKLLQAVQPDKAYFGEKDYQQLLIVKKMVALEKMPVEIVPCAIFREPNGLAMSSRNRLLSDETFASAGFIYQQLLWAQSHFSHTEIGEIKERIGKEFANQKAFRLEYFEIAESQTLKLAQKFKKNIKYRAFIAVYAENVRLIDNLALN